MLKITCDICKKELNEQGALYFTPPVNGKCEKLHICTKCHKTLMVLMKTLQDENYGILYRGD